MADLFEELPVTLKQRVLFAAVFLTLRDASAEERDAFLVSLGEEIADVAWWTLGVGWKSAVLALSRGLLGGIWWASRGRIAAISLPRRRF